MASVENYFLIFPRIVYLFGHPSIKVSVYLLSKLSSNQRVVVIHLESAVGYTLPKNSMLFSSILLFLLIGYPYRFIFYKYCLIKKLGGADEADQVVTILPSHDQIKDPYPLGNWTRGPGHRTRGRWIYDSTYIPLWWAWAIVGLQNLLMAQLEVRARRMWSWTSPFKRRPKDSKYNFFTVTKTMCDYTSYCQGPESCSCHGSK